MQPSGCQDDKPRSGVIMSQVVCDALERGRIDRYERGRSAHKRGRTAVGMTIIGHGVDLVDIAELRRWIEDPRDPLIPRCFIQEELDEVGNGPDRVERLAGRFAAKEAVLK